MSAGIQSGSHATTTYCPSSRNTCNNASADHHGTNASRALEHHSTQRTCSHGVECVVPSPKVCQGAVEQIIDQSDHAS